MRSEGAERTLMFRETGGLHGGFSNIQDVLRVSRVLQCLKGLRCPLVAAARKCAKGEALLLLPRRT